MKILVIFIVLLCGCCPNRNEIYWSLGNERKILLTLQNSYDLQCAELKNKAYIITSKKPDKVIVSIDGSSIRYYYEGKMISEVNMDRFDANYHCVLAKGKSSEKDESIVCEFTLSKNTIDSAASR